MGKFVMSMDELKANKPGNDVVMLTLGQDVSILGKTGKKLPWANKQSDEVRILNNGKEELVPLTRLLGCVVSKQGIVKNEGTNLECVDHSGNTLFDFLVSKAKGDVIEIPEKIHPTRRINKGAPKSMITAPERQQLYVDAKYTGGKEFAEAFAEAEFLPSLYKNADGSIRPNGTYVIETPAV